MPLSQIRDFLSNKDIDCITEKLYQQKQIILKKKEEPNRIEQKINHRMEWIEDTSVSHFR